MSIHVSQAAAVAAIHEAAPDAIELNHITAALDAELHSVYLDQGAGLVHHAYADLDGAPSGLGQWRIDIQPASEAVIWIEQQCHQALERIADPDLYVESGGDARRDLDLLDEITAVHAAVHAGADEKAIDDYLNSRVERARSEMQRAMRLAAMIRAAHIRALVEQHDRNGRGGKAAVARLLDKGEATIGQVISGDDERREALIAAAEKARSNT